MKPASIRQQVMRLKEDEVTLVFDGIKRMARVVNVEASVGAG